MKYLGKIEHKKDLINKEYAENNFCGQLSTMPAASAELLGKIYQYVGTTTTDYTNGYFYKCAENSGAYSWVEISVQAGGGVGVDNSTIDFNASEQLEVKDGGLTVAKFNSTAISTEIPDTGAVDTKFTTEKAVSDLFSALKSSIVDLFYPVNSRYVQLAGMPNPSTFGGSWAVDTTYNGKALWVDSNKTPGTEIAAGLPNIKGSTVLQGNQGYDYSHDYFKLSKDCFSAEADKSIGELATQSSLNSSGVARNNNNTQKLVFDASTGQYDSTDTKQTGDDVVYGKADTVQPPAITVKVWIRTA